MVAAMRVVEVMVKRRWDRVQVLCLYRGVEYVVTWLMSAFDSEGKQADMSGRTDTERAKQEGRSTLGIDKEPRY